MSQRSCDLCGNPAVIHDTLTRAGVVKVRHLCRVHGLQLWHDALPQVATSAQATPKDPVFQSLIAEAGKLMQRRSDGPAK